MSADRNDTIVVGIGGAAIGFASRVAALNPGIHVVGFDSDSSSRDAVGVSFVQLGSARCEGCGCGGDAVKARAAAIDDIAAIREAVAGARLAAVAVSLGGGFGSGAAPEILKVMRDEGIATFCFATTPFAFEGGDRAAAARRALPLIEGIATATAPISLDTIFAGAAGDSIRSAYLSASATLSKILSLFWKLSAQPGFISLGAERIAAVAAKFPGTMRVAVASASGEGRAAAAAEGIVTSRLPGPDARLDCAGALIAGVIAGDDLRLAELTDISNALSARIPATCRRDFGVIIDDSVAGSIELVCILFEKGNIADVDENTTAPERPSQSRRASRKTSGRKDALLEGIAGAHFKGTDGTIYAGQNLDIPTYLRRSLPLEK